MWYYIYLEDRHAFQQQVGRARFKVDAVAMFDRQGAGFITHGGQVIKQKNMVGEPWVDKTEEN